MRQVKVDETRQRLPNLYQLLSLEPLEDDRNRIEHALKLLHAQAKAAEGANEKAAARAARLFELGKHNLLSADRKLAYDQQWMQVYGTPPEVGESASEWDYEELEKFLPPGDPAKPFDLASFLQQAPPPGQDTFEADYQNLRTMLSSSQMGRNVSAAIVAQPVALRTWATHTPTVVAKPIAGSQLSSIAAGSLSDRSLANRIRKKRERSLLWGAAGVLASLAAVLGVIFFLLNGNDEPNPRRLTSPSESSTNTNDVLAANNPTTQRPDAPRRSRLPQVPGLESNGFAASTATDTGMADAPTIETAAAPPSFDTPPTGLNSVAVNSMPTAADAESKSPIPSPPTAAGANPGEMNASPPLAPIAANSTEKELSENEKANWLSTLTEAKALMGQQQYEAAGVKLDAAAERTKTEVQRGQLRRLQTINTLAEQFHSALIQAIAGLGAAETFTVGSSIQASFVEGDAAHLVVKLNGQTQRFTLTELPIGLAYALVDLKMDIAHPTSLAKKAAFTLVHPTSLNNDLALQRARKMMSEAIAARAVDPDILSVFSDDFF